MNGEPEIKFNTRLLLVGMKRNMSITNNETIELWKSFMPLSPKISKREGNEYFSVEVYSGLDYFNEFDPTKEFLKWAALRVEDHEKIPDTMEGLIIPEGRYAVFTYRGYANMAYTFYQYIFTDWLPNSAYQLDDRPHFAVMGEDYRNDDPNSEEEIWIPIQ